MPRPSTTAVTTTAAPVVSKRAGWTNGCQSNIQFHDQVKFCCTKTSTTRSGGLPGVRCGGAAGSVSMTTKNKTTTTAWCRYSSKTRSNRLCNRRLQRDGVLRKLRPEPVGLRFRHGHRQLLHGYDHGNGTTRCSTRCATGARSRGRSAPSTAAANRTSARSAWS
jgi:hypothetical protein